MQDVAAYLVEHGIAEDRIHFLQGEDGLAFLDGIGNWFTRLLSDAHTAARAKVVSGAVMVGIFDVDDDDVGATRTILDDAGIVETEYYGKWTNLP